MITNINRPQALQDFLRLAEKCFPGSQFEENHPILRDRTIIEYTEDSFFDKLINITIRSSTNPL